MKISNAVIKEIVRQQSDVRISDSAAGALAKILEKKAKDIAKYAVQRARKHGRQTVMEEDIDTYRIKFGD